MKRTPCPARYIGLGFVLSATLAINACGQRSGTVSGVVTYQGKAVPAGTVLFVGDDKNPARGPISSDGSYQIRNVPIGAVKIAVLVPPPPPRKDDPNPPPPAASTVVIPQKYANADTSDLTYTVTTGSQTHPIDLK